MLLLSHGIAGLRCNTGKHFAQGRRTKRCTFHSFTERCVQDRKFSGSGSDTDIMISSARAYISAVNKLLSWNARRVKQNDEGEANGSAVGDAEPVESVVQA